MHTTDRERPGAAASARAIVALKSLLDARSSRPKLYHGYSLVDATGDRPRRRLGYLSPGLWLRALPWHGRYSVPGYGDVAIEPTAEYAEYSEVEVYLSGAPVARVTTREYRYAWNVSPAAGATGNVIEVTWVEPLSPARLSQELRRLRSAWGLA